MRLTFPNGEHPDVGWEQGEVTIGSRAGVKIVLPQSGLAAHHASFSADRRGMWLGVPSSGSGVHLNARPVKRMALLRIGDLVCLENVRILIRADEQPAIDRDIPPAPVELPENVRASSSRVVLRGVAGSHYGRTYTLTEPKVIGRSANADIRIDDPSLADKHAQIELHGDRVVLRALNANDGSVLNGIPVRDAVMAPGDQLVIDQNRFVLEAPGLPLRGQGHAARPSSVAHTQTIKAVRREANDSSNTAQESPPSPPARDPGALWWLIAAATVLAAALTALLVYSPNLSV